MRIRREIVLKPINALIPKRNDYVYAVAHTNGRNDCYDLLNYSADNLLTVLHELITLTSGIKCTVFLECFSESRMKIIQSYLDSNKSDIIIKPIVSHITREHRKFNWWIFFKNLLIRYRCRIWINDTGFHHYYEKLNSQRYFCLNYSTPLKSAIIINRKDSFKNIDGYLETSKMTALIHAAEFQVKLPNCAILGFPRNDNLFRLNTDVKNKICRWIRSKTSVKYTTLVVYAPTYRDYSGAYDNVNIFGYVDTDNQLDSFLEKNNILVIAKMHPLQEVNSASYSKNIIQYEANYDFSLYNLLAYSDILVSDYSSVIHDFILTGKKIIFNFFDKDRYRDSRGFAFEPLEYVCPGPIVSSLNNLMTELTNKTLDREYIEHYKMVINMFHRFKDDSSAKRVIDYLIPYLKGEK